MKKWWCKHIQWRRPKGHIRSLWYDLGDTLWVGKPIEIGWKYCHYCGKAKPKDNQKEA